MHIHSLALIREKLTLLRAAASASLVKMREVPLSSKTPVEDKLPTVFPPTFAPLNSSAQYLRV